MEKILLVEDDITLSIGIEYTLRKEGFDVIVAHDLKDAENNFNSNSFDLILLDVTLPDGNGYDFCKKIRNISSIPIIFLTACDDEVNIVLGLDIGGDDYITKPFRVKELISRIKAVLRRRKINDSKTDNKTMIEAGSIKVDLINIRAWKNDKEVSLTPMEWKLLSVFIQNPSRIFSRNTLLEKIWDISGEFIDDNTISVHIRRLREKLEDDPSNPQYIETIWGMGYRWNNQ